MRKLVLAFTTSLFVLLFALPVQSPATEVDYTHRFMSPPVAESDKNDYIEAIFAPPGEEEIEAVYESIRYEPSCQDFEIGDVYEQEPGFTMFFVTYTSDGFKQTGLFGLPDGDGPFKLLVMNHSGLSGIPASEVRLLEDFKQNGYAIVMATYRGEKGAAGLAEGNVDVFGDESHDIRNLMTCAVEHEKIDPDKIAMLAISHGGGLSVLCLSQLDNVKAAALISAPINLMGEPIRNMAYTWYKQPARIEAPLQILMTPVAIKKMKSILGLVKEEPERVPEFRWELLRRSPVFFVNHIQTPIIIFYGGQDPVSFPEDGERLVSSLMARNIDAKMTVFPEQGHGFVPDKIEIVFAEIFEFLNSIVEQ